jgi:hypothetical protein
MVGVDPLWINAAPPGVGKRDPVEKTARNGEPELPHVPAEDGRDDPSEDQENAKEERDDAGEPWVLAHWALGLTPRRLAGLAKAFPQQEILVTTWVVVYRSQSLKAALRVKGWSLEGERCEKDLPTAASASLVLCCSE